MKYELYKYMSVVLYLKDRKRAFVQGGGSHEGGPEGRWGEGEGDPIFPALFVTKSHLEIIGI